MRRLFRIGVLCVVALGALQASAMPLGYRLSRQARAAVRQAKPAALVVGEEVFGSLGEVSLDDDGNIVVTRLDEQILRDVAAAGNGAYIHAGNEEFGLNPIIDDIRKMEAEKFKSVVFEEYDEQYMYFFAAALALFVLELLIGERRAKRRLFE
jgi:hypothetical protein